jgi:hypothetical protein
VTFIDPGQGWTGSCGLNVNASLSVSCHKLLASLPLALLMFNIGRSPELTRVSRG